MRGTDRVTGRCYHFCDVNVVTLTDPAVRAGQTVVVDSGRITAIGAAEAVAIPADSQPIPGKGRYLLPGLVDRSVEEPGLTCIPEITRGRRRLLSWVSRSLLDTMPQNGKPGSERDPLELASPPAWAVLSSTNARAWPAAALLVVSAARESVAERGHRAAALASRRSLPTGSGRGTEWWAW